MIIHLTNFNNLKHIDYDIKNKKVNFLFGISGSGKSSIAKAFNAQELSEFVTAGEPYDSCAVRIEGNEYGDEHVPIYDYGYMNSILIQKTNKNDIYSIICAGEEALSQYRTEYDEYLGSFKTFKDHLVIIKNNIFTLRRVLKIEFKKDKTYKSNCLIRSFEDTVISKGKNTLARKFAGNKAQWFLEGAKTEEYALGKCPFCSKKLSEQRKGLIESIISIDFKSFEKITKQTPVFQELNLNLPVWNNKRSTNKFRHRLWKLLEAEEEIDRLINVINASYKTEFEIQSLEKIRLSKEVKMLFPELNDALTNFNDSISSAKRTLGKIKSKTTSIISKNINSVNEYLKRFSIPYIFTKTAVDDDNRAADYVLIHVCDKAATDRSNSLSFGEKNIIGLILFLLTYKNRKMLIIDDPASSFDNFRRKIILDLIFETKQSESTILVLSHDEVFIKLALYYAKNSNRKYSSQIGNTTFIENNEKADLIEISYDDFDYFDAFIKERLKDLPAIINYQTAILIRLLYENKIRRTGIEITVYGYLSAILHKKPFDDIKASVDESIYSIEDVIDNIYKITGIKFHPLESDYLTSYKTLRYNDFELLALFRELIKDSRDNKTKAIKNELNSIIHLSSTYITSLNPFKFKMYSRQTHDYLEEAKRQLLNL